MRMTAVILREDTGGLQAIAEVQAILWHGVQQTG